MKRIELTDLNGKRQSVLVADIIDFKPTSSTVVGSPSVYIKETVTMVIRQRSGEITFMNTYESVRAAIANRFDGFMILPVSDIDAYRVIVGDSVKIPEALTSDEAVTLYDVLRNMLDVVGADNRKWDDVAYYLDTKMPCRNTNYFDLIAKLERIRDDWSQSLPPDANGSNQSRSASDANAKSGTDQPRPLTSLRGGGVSGEGTGDKEPLAERRITRVGCVPFSEFKAVVKTAMGHIGYGFGEVAMLLYSQYAIKELATGGDIKPDPKRVEYEDLVGTVKKWVYEQEIPSPVGVDRICKFVWDFFEVRKSSHPWMPSKGMTIQPSTDPQAFEHAEDYEDLTRETPNTEATNKVRTSVCINRSLYNRSVAEGLDLSLVLEKAILKSQGNGGGT